MSLKNSINRLRQAIAASLNMNAGPSPMARKSKDPLIAPNPIGGDICNCCTVMVDGMSFCDCYTEQAGVGVIFQKRYAGPCTGSGGGPAGSTRMCPCNANQPTIG